jgi:hypothetical protein
MFTVYPLTFVFQLAGSSVQGNICHSNKMGRSMNLIFNLKVSFLQLKKVALEWLMQAGI